MTASLRSPRSPRSPRSSATISPAGLFLSTWGQASAAAAAPAPDDAGQKVGEYVLGKQIGYGGSSIVREAHGVERGTPVRRAVKILRKQLSGRSGPENEALQAEFEREVALWRCLSHRHILPLLFVYQTPFATFCFTDLYPAGTLFDLVRANRRGLPLALARHFAFQLALALRYLHRDMRVVHRDVKLENCLVDMPSGPAAAAAAANQSEGANLLLCDFGMAEVMPSECNGRTRGGQGVGHAAAAAAAAAATPLSANAYSKHGPDGVAAPFPAHGAAPARGDEAHATSVAGSLQYAAPELLRPGAPGHISPALDVWAFGVVLYALLVGDLPFRHTFLPRLQIMILKGEWDQAAVRTAVAAHSSSSSSSSSSSDGSSAAESSEVDDALDLLRCCFRMNPDERWTIEQVLDSSFFRKRQPLQLQQQQY